jgi:hypothetical protein
MYYCGSNFKKEDDKRAQLMIENSASAGFPMAVAFCCYYGWNGLKKDHKKAFDMFVVIEKETKGKWHCCFDCTYCRSETTGAGTVHGWHSDWFSHCLAKCLGYTTTINPLTHAHSFSALSLSRKVTIGLKIGWGSVTTMDLAPRKTTRNPLNI